MNALGDNKVRPIPDYLSIHWGWLLVADVLGGMICHHFRWGERVPFTIFGLWGFLQAAWLVAADKRSRAIYWYAVPLAINLIFGTSGLWRHLASLPVGRPTLLTILAIFVAVEVALTITSYFVFRYELERYCNEAGAGFALSRWITLFCGPLYFQYYLHNIAEAQIAGLNITHVST